MQNAVHFMYRLTNNFLCLNVIFYVSTSMNKPLKTLIFFIFFTKGEHSKGKKKH